MVSTAATFAKRCFGAICRSMPHLSAIVALFLTHWTLLALLRFLGGLVTGAAFFCGVAFLATLLTLVVLVGAVLDLVIFTAAAIAKLRRGAIRHGMTSLTAIEATLLAWSTLLLLLCLLLRWLAFLALAFALVTFLALALALAHHRLHLFPIVCDRILLVFAGIMARDFIPGVGLAVLGIDAFLRHGLSLIGSFLL